MPHINKILKGLTGRYIFLIILSVTVIVVLALRLVQLQLSQDGDYIDALRRQSLRPIRIPAVRGRIESSDGKILVDNKVSYDLMFYLKEFKIRGAGSMTRTSEYMASVLQQLARTLNLKSDLSQRTILTRLVDESRAKIKLVEKLSREQKKELKSHNLPPFIVREDNQIFLDYSKVRLLSKMGSYARTSESICREIDRVSSLIGRPMRNHRKEIDLHLRQKPALPYKALEDLTPQELSIIAEMLPPLNGTSIEPNTRREYPFPEAYSHLLGYTRLKYLTKDDEKEKADFYYYLHSLYGVSGLESKMNDSLVGSAGRRVVQVNIAGFVQPGEEGKHNVINNDELDKFNYEPSNGKNVVLTLDHEAQMLAYNLLKNLDVNTMSVKPQEGEAIRAAFVLMDCNTGAIKAMVSTPSYDLSKFRFKDYYSKITNPEKGVPYQLKQQPLINRSLSAYEPGSIIKPLLSLAALEYSELDPYTELECEGFYELPTGKKIRDAARWGHGLIDLPGAIEQSCNKYFITLGVEIGVEKMRRLYKHAGLGRYPMALNDKSARFTQEKSGRIPGGSPWYFADTAYASIGQGKITVSPLQAAVFVGAIANGGKVLKPQFIKEVRGPKNKKILKEMEFPIYADTLPISAENIEVVQQGMRRVIVGENAGAIKAQALIPGAMELAGKTGTAEVNYYEVDEEGKLLRDSKGKLNKAKKIKNTWFTAFGPYEEPKYVAVCFVQGGIFGGTTCAPIVRKFFDTWSKTKPQPVEEEKTE